MTDWRRYALPVVLWVYGMAVTLTLVSIWGRAVVVDSDLVSQAAAETAHAGPVAARIEAWLAGELVEEGGVDDSTANDIASSAVHDPALEDTVSDLVGAVVSAAALPPGAEVVVDVAEILRPAAPALTAHMQDAGVPIDEAAVSDYVASLDPLVVRQPDERPVFGPSSGAARTLYLGTIIGLMVVCATGAVALLLSQERRVMLRSLFNRIALSALGFAVFFQLGAWFLDPGAGRAPFRLAASRLVAAKLWLLALIAIAAGLAGWALRSRARRRRVTPEAESPSPAALSR